MYGLIAELHMVETPRMAWNNLFTCKSASTKRVTLRTYLYKMAKLCVTGLLGHKSLSEDLIHNIGKVGHDEDQNHPH